MDKNRMISARLWRYLLAIWPKSVKGGLPTAFHLKHCGLPAAGAVLLLLGMLPAAFAQATAPDSLRIRLEQLFARADTTNLSLQSLRYRSRADSARIAAAHAPLLPQIGADADLSLLDILPKTKAPFIGDGPADALLSGGVSQKIWDGGRTRAEIQAQEAALTITGTDRTILRQSIRLKIAESFYRLSGLRRELEVIDENLAMIDERIRFTGLLIDAGRMSEIDRGRFEVARSQLQGRRLQVEHAYRSASRTIGVLCGFDTEIVLVPAGTLDTTLSKMAMEPIADANDLKTSPVIAKQAALIERAEAGTKKAKATRMPSVWAKAWYGWEFANAGFSFIDNDRWFAGLHATVPIFDGHGARKKMAAARNAVESARLDREDRLREVVSSAQVLSDALVVLRDRIAIAKKTTAQAKENLRLGVIEYEAGRRSNMDIIDMQSSVLQAQLAVASLLVDYTITQSRIRSLAGEL